LDHKLNTIEDEAPEEQLPQRKAITFVELDEKELQAEEKKAPVVVVEEAAPVPVRKEAPAEPVQPQVIHTVVQTSTAGEETAQQLAKLLGSFSFDAIRSEIDHRFEKLRRDLEEKSVAPVHEPETPEQPAATAAFRIETARIPAAEQEQAPVPEKKDYSDLIISDEAQSDQTGKESSGGVDIMALLSAQAKKMESLSTIEMMEIYGEEFTEVTLAELEKYINKNHK
jgi:hypothetical protein